MEIIVFLNDAEYKALAYVARDPQEWAENAVKERARIAMDEIFQAEISRMIADPNIVEIPADKERVVLDADLQSAAEREANSLSQGE